MGSAWPGRSPKPPGSIQDSLDEVPEWYRNDPAWKELIKDPDHGGRVTESSIREAMVALEAQRQGVIPYGVKRGPKRVDFIDGKGGRWDVKAPPGGAGFNAGEQAGKLLDRLRKRKDGARFLIDTTYMAQQEYEDLWRELKQAATMDEIEAFVLINVRL